MSRSLAFSTARINAPRALNQPAARRPLPNRNASKLAPARRPTAERSTGARAKRNGQEILVAVRSMIDDANLENVCLVVAGIPYAPSGTGVVRPGNTSSLIELPPEASGTKAAVYFELALGNHRIPLLTDQVFAFAAGAVCVLTITDHTRAHSPPIEIEGAVVRLVRARESATGTERRLERSWKERSRS